MLKRFSKWVCYKCLAWLIAWCLTINFMAHNIFTEIGEQNQEVLHLKWRNETLSKEKKTWFSCQARSWVLHLQVTTEKIYQKAYRLVGRLAPNCYLFIQVQSLDCLYLTSLSILRRLRIALTCNRFSFNKISEYPAN